MMWLSSGWGSVINRCVICICVVCNVRMVIRSWFELEVLKRKNL